MTRPTLDDTPGARFEALLEPHHDLLRRYVYRLVGNPTDAEDLVQDILTKGLERLGSLRNETAFKSWLFKLATRTCVDHLRKQTRWRPYSQRYLEDACNDDHGKRQRIVDTTRDPEFLYDVCEHIAFCFTCVGRSLDPLDAAALVLREVIGFSNREAAMILGVSDSVLRHHLGDGRRAMEETFDGLCSLVNKDGICWQCSSFRSATAASRRGPSLPVLDDRATAWRKRLAIVRQSHFLDGVAAPLHDLLFTLLDQLESA